MMRRSASGCFFVIAFLFFLTNVCFAAEVSPVGMWGIGGRVSFYNLQNYDIVEDVQEVDTPGRPFFEGNVTWFARKWLSLEFSGGYTKTNFDLKGPGGTLDLGDFQQIPLLLTARFHLWHPGMGGTFYAGGGAGYYINEYDLPVSVPGASVSADNSFGAHVALGFEGFITKNWCINGDLKYIWNEANFSVTVPPPYTSLSAEDSLDLDAFVLGIGVKYYF